MIERDVQPITENIIPAHIGWLADAPFFIDEQQISSFYDAVVRPDGEQGDTQLEFTAKKAEQVKRTMNAKGGMSLGLGWIFSGIGPTVSGEVRGGKENINTGTETNSAKVTLKPIKTPQRQLVHLALHYLANQWQRLFLVNDPSERTWCNREAVEGLPRGLVFLDLPGITEANEGNGKISAKFIPVAAEFGQNNIERLYDKLQRKSGENPPQYPEDSPESVANYWGWFAKEFSPRRVMRVIEDTAANKGPVRWIRYSVPVNEASDCLKLIFYPAGKFDTGVFAYNLIWDTYNNGVRLVGTLKSGPELNVLAAYEK